MTEKKAKKPPALDIKREMSAFDNKSRNFYDSLNDEERKEFSGYMMIRWGASVDYNRRLNDEENYFLQAYYVSSTNERLNKHFFDVNTAEHEKLQWLLATTVSPGMGAQYHPWIGLPKKSNDNKAIKFLRQLYPTAKQDELELLAEINDRDDLKDMARELGWDDKRIKSEL